MTTYTLTQAQYDELAANAQAFDSSTLAILASLKPNSQEPVGFLSKNEHLYETLCAAGEGSEPLYIHPAPMSKEDMVKVLWALNNLLYFPHIKDKKKFCDVRNDAVKATTIMQSAIEGMK